jgi:hypothetical protein
MYRKTLVSLCLASLAAMAVAAAGASAATAPWNPGVGKQSTCTRTISPGASIESNYRALPSGGILCLRGGIYTEADDQISLASLSNRKIAGYQGERAVFRGSVRGDSAVNVELEGFKIEAQYAPAANRSNNTEQAVNGLDSTGLTLDSMHLQNRGVVGGVRRGGSCIFSGASKDMFITHLLIQSCGEHGIYGGSTARGMRVEHVFIRDVELNGFKWRADFGGSDFNGVVIDRTTGPLPGTGTYEEPNQTFEAAVANDTASSNTVRNSVLDTHNDEAWIFPNLYRGSNNTLQNLCTNPAGNYTRKAASDVVTGVVVAAPQFSSTGYKVTNPTCAAKLPADSPFRP